MSPEEASNDGRATLIARLDAFMEFPGTIPLFDALSAPEGPEHAVGVAAVVERFPNHPLARELQDWLHVHGIEVAAPSAAAVLAELGIDDLRVWYDRRQRERVALERALSEALEGQAAASLSANAYSFMCVLLFFVALLGWTAAFDVWEFTPEGPLPGPHDPKPEVAPVEPGG